MLVVVHRRPPPAAFYDPRPPANKCASGEPTHDAPHVGDPVHGVILLKSDIEFTPDRTLYISNYEEQDDDHQPRPASLRGA
jgi:hypothetical protein